MTQHTKISDKWGWIADVDLDASPLKQMLSQLWKWKVKHHLPEIAIQNRNQQLSQTRTLTRADDSKGDRSAKGLDGLVPPTQAFTLGSTILKGPTSNKPRLLVLVRRQVIPMALNPLVKRTVVVFAGWGLSWRQFCCLPVYAR